jgi:hypothetical protein
VLHRHYYAGLAQLLAAVADSLAADLQQYSAASSVNNATSQQQQQQQHVADGGSGKADAAAERGAAAAAAAEAEQQFHQAYHLSYCLVFLWTQLMQYLPQDSESFRVLMPGAALPLAVLRTYPAAATAAQPAAAAAVAQTVSQGAQTSVTRQLPKHQLPRMA